MGIGVVVYIMLAIGIVEAELSGTKLDLVVEGELLVDDDVVVGGHGVGTNGGGD